LLKNTNMNWTVKKKKKNKKKKRESKFYKLISKRRMISFMHRSILRQIWLSFMALWFLSSLSQFSHICFFILPTLSAWASLKRMSRNAYLVHQNWHRISFTFYRLGPSFYNFLAPLLKKDVYWPVHARGIKRILSEKKKNHSKFVIMLYTLQLLCPLPFDIVAHCFAPKQSGRLKKSLTHYNIVKVQS
jgi:hypothetical protein